MSPEIDKSEGYKAKASDVGQTALGASEVTPPIITEGVATSIPNDNQEDIAIALDSEVSSLGMD